MTQAISGSLFCAGQDVNIAFETGVLTFDVQNQFIAQLSDPNGSFDSPITIGSISSSIAGTIQATFPADLSDGLGYLVRVVSTSPALTGSNNGVNLTINSIPKITTTAPGGR